MSAGTTVVVFVHGLWMRGWEGTLLRRRLGKALGAEVPRFSYPSVRLDIRANARLLGEFLARFSVDSLHLVGHSLGGLVILHMLDQRYGEQLPPGRVVLLGSPLAGSRAANALSRWQFGRRIMGRSIDSALLPPSITRWDAARELGVVAGTRNVGLGRLVTRNLGPSDGTVFVDETQIGGIKQRLEMPVSHSGLPFSAPVSVQIATFLSTGRFAGSSLAGRPVRRL